FSDNLVFTACGTNGLQIFDFSSAGFSEEENMDAFFMEVTPNPSNGNASVHFQLSQQSNVRLNIYDMSGRLVAKPFSSIYTPGQCNIELGYLPSGIYIASLNADGKTASRQFAVLR
ncbi:MAG: T9SS type A sorting domain-containing protein, partial [Candidatus Sabulitectum sp.]|nr:T9SS type A sorting domain-containing protein [Candidatus Sabulitectum sp.]